MFDDIFGRLPTKGILVCTVLTFVGPYLVNKFNQRLHDWGDPPWKREEDNNTK